MPKVSITDSKGLVQSQGTGFESQKMPKSSITHALSVTSVVPAAADAAGVSYSGKYFVVASKSAKYQLYFSSVAAVAATVPTALPGHTLVAIGNIAADANAATVAAAIVAAVGAGAGAGLSDMTAVAAGANVTIATALPETSAVPSSLGTLDSTHFTTFTQLKRGSGDSSFALRPGAINVLDFPDFGAGFTAINADASGAPDLSRFTMAAGDYLGQECTVIRAKNATNNVEAVLQMTMTIREDDGGGIQANKAIEFEAGAQTDGTPLIKAVWDGSAWIHLLPAIAELGWSKP